MKYALTKIALAVGAAIGLVALAGRLTEAQNFPPCYFDTSTPTQVRFKNETGRPIAIYWQNFQCEALAISDVIQPGWSLTLNAFLNIPLQIYDADTGDLFQELKLTSTTPSEVVLRATALIDQSEQSTSPEASPSIASVDQATAPSTGSGQLAQSQWIQTILAIHNRYRSEVNVLPLTWSSQLANDAQIWADRLASSGNRTLRHDPNANDGENLWMGTSGAFTLNHMLDSWGQEKQYFTNGIFPNVSPTHHWSEVGHYTQMIWSDTTEVGCAISTGSGFDFLVCRYSPPGNFQGQRVY